MNMQRGCAFDTSSFLGILFLGFDWKNKVDRISVIT